MQLRFRKFLILSLPHLLKQQTANPLAQEPEAVPPLEVHSLDVRHVPEGKVVLSVVHASSNIINLKNGQTTII